MKYTDEELANEIWKDIKNYEGYYQISNLGRIKSLSRLIDRGNYTLISKERILNVKTAKNTFSRVKLYNDIMSCIVNIKLLTINYFIPNPNNYNYISCVNNDMTDVRANNMKWIKGESTETIYTKEISTKTIIVYNTKVEINTHGVVKVNNKIRPHQFFSRDHLTPTVYIKGIKKKSISRLLLLAFKPNETGKYVYYLDGNHRNLQLSNLITSKHKQKLFKNSIPDYINPNIK